MTYWACARLEPRREAVAQHFLKLNGYETYIPRVREQRLGRGKRIETISFLFPAYAFIVIEQQWHRARWSIGVAALIMDGEHPARVPDQVIAGIRAREVRGAVELPKSSGLKPGDHVKILSGPFRGHLALYAQGWRVCDGPAVPLFLHHVVVSAFGARPRIHQSGG